MRCPPLAFIKPAAAREAAVRVGDFEVWNLQFFWIVDFEFLALRILAIRPKALHAGVEQLNELARLSAVIVTMSESPETEFDLEKLFLPAWAQDSPAVNKYADFKGEEPRERRPGRGPPWGGPRSEGSRPGGGPKRGGSGRPQDARGRAPGREGGGPWRGARQPAQELRPPAPLPALEVTILPDEKGVESLARQIRITGRAYPLFQIAQLFLQKPERQQISLATIKNADGQPAQPLFHCALDDSLWLSEEEAVSHVLSRHFATFYQAERTPTDPPKGIYTFVAQCGMSGVILGPPNYHDYQNQLRKLHAERFSRVPFEAFKARVKMVRDAEVVKKWVEEHSFKTQYLCLNVSEELKLPTREEVEKHFRAVHLPNLIKQVPSYSMSGATARQLPSQALQRLLRAAGEEQRRFPLKLATILSQKFAGHGLQFFKVNRTVTHVSVARPHYLDLDATPVSEGVRKIVQFVEATPKCTRRRLLETLAPAPASAESGAASPAEIQATTDQTALAADLHWLIHQGHVIEFANGVLETAKKPAPRPPRPEKPQTAAPAQADAPVAHADESEPALPSNETLAEAAAAPQTHSEEGTVATDVCPPLSQTGSESLPHQPTPEPSSAQLADGPKPVAPASADNPATSETAQTKVLTG
jgi:hypothetical protein